MFFCKKREREAYFKGCRDTWELRWDYPKYLSKTIRNLQRGHRRKNKLINRLRKRIAELEKGGSDG